MLLPTQPLVDAACRGFAQSVSLVTSRWLAVTGHPTAPRVDRQSTRS